MISFRYCGILFLYPAVLTYFKEVSMQMSSRFVPKDPGSAATHLIGFVGAVFLTVPLLTQAVRQGRDDSAVLALGIFMLNMELLYAASTLYHTIDGTPKVNRFLKRFDHMMIYLLIAGTYTPICVIALPDTVGANLLRLVWGIAAVGLTVSAIWVNCPRWFSAAVYICMGWVCLTALPQIIAALSSGGFLWLLAGGIFYTVGGIIYALKLRLLNERFPNFGSHEIFHLFVLAGSFCHFVVMYEFLPL